MGPLYRFNDKMLFFEKYLDEGLVDVGIGAVPDVPHAAAAAAFGSGAPLVFLSQPLAILHQQNE